MEKTVLKKEVENMLNDLPDDANWNDLLIKFMFGNLLSRVLKIQKPGELCPM